MADETKRPASSASTGAAAKRGSRAKGASAPKPDTVVDPAAPESAKPETATEAAAAPVAATVSPSPASLPPASSAPAAAPAYKPAPSTPGPSPATASDDASGPRNGVALAGLLAGLIGIVLALTYPHWTPIVYGPSDGDRRVTAEQVRAELTGEIGALKTTIAGLEQNQAAMEQAVRTAKLPGILMIAENLRSALDGSEPYSSTLNLFRALTGDDEGASAIVAAVEARAASGVPTIYDLQYRFDEIAHAVIVAEQRPEATGNLASQVSETVASLTAATMRLRWRIDGAPTGDGVAAVVARSEIAVAAGDLQAAIDTLGLLPANRAALAQSWIDAARARLSVSKTQEDLDAYIIMTASQIR